MSSECRCHVEDEFCFYCEVYAPVVAENERLREAIATIMHVSRLDGIAHELDRCYSIARDALKEVLRDGTTQESAA